jgi:hypothetical protein
MQDLFLECSISVDTKWTNWNEKNALPRGKEEMDYITLIHPIISISLIIQQEYSIPSHPIPSHPIQTNDAFKQCPEHLYRCSVYALYPCTENVGWDAAVSHI